MAYNSNDQTTACVHKDGNAQVRAFGCNGARPQPSVAVGAAATDLTTALALLNKVRAALIANGICKDA